MASSKDTATFFLEGDSKQFDIVLKLYPEALQLKADARAKKELIKLDNWYQNELPQKIKARGKDAHLVHEELVQLMKWKQTRGKFYPQLSYLVKVNTPRAVMTVTKKAFRKMPNIELAITALSNLKGVGTTTASALLAAMDPEVAPFMADECLKAIPEMDGIDYTAKEYLNFVSHIRNTCDRLNKEQNGSGELKWSPHSVELAVWAHCIVSELKPELLGGGVDGEEEDGDVGGVGAARNGAAAVTETSDESNLEPPVITNGKLAAESLDEATTSCTEDSLDKAASPLPANNKRSADIVDGSSEDNSTGAESVGVEPESEQASEVNKAATGDKVDEPPAKKAKAVAQ